MISSEFQKSPPTSMIETFQTLIRISLFQSKPQDLMSSTRTLTVCVVLALLLSIIRINHITLGANSLAISLLQVLLLGLGLKILLSLFAKSERWLQSATALFGCSALLLLLTTPFILGSQPSDLSTTAFPSVKFLLVGINLWYFAITVYILKETLEIKIILAILIGFCMEVIFATVLLKFFGDQIL